MYTVKDPSKNEVLILQTDQPLNVRMERAGSGLTEGLASY